ncbi:MAG: hypothetical protein V8S14_01815 [Lachnospiraceae bacterium]
MTSKIPPALPVIQADPVKLRQLLLNLLTNAKAAVLSPALKNTEQLPSIFLEARLAEQSCNRDPGQWLRYHIGTT